MFRCAEYGFRPEVAFSLAMALSAAVTALNATEAVAQSPVEGEVRQLVTFRFLPGRAQEALSLYQRDAIPLYQRDNAMLSFRGFREVESPVPLDLIVVSAFRGMAGMDDSNRALSTLARANGTSVGAIYGAIGALSSSHDDQFIEMLPRLGTGDATSRRLVALVWYRTEAGHEEVLENLIASRLQPWESARGSVSSMGRFLVSDDWTHLRILGFDSLGDYHKYQSDLRLQPWAGLLRGEIQRHREVILAVVPEFSVR